MLVFQGLIRTGKAADVAAELGLTNSSISHALTRLRDIFDDELFLRRPHGMEPTAFARQVSVDVDKALQSMQDALSDAPDFDPASAQSHLRVSARDSEIASALPRILSRLRERAPGMTVSVRSMAAGEALRALRDANIDLAMGFFATGVPEIDYRDLRREGYLVVARQNHPLMDGPLTLEAYCQAEHVLVAADGSTRGIVDDTLARTGHQRKVVLSLPQFLPTLAMVSQSDTIATLPGTIVRRYAAAFDLQFAPPPLEIRTFDIRILTHVRDRRNAAVQWVVNEMLATVEPRATATEPGSKT